jgi:hypothetical protein
LFFADGGTPLAVLGKNQKTSYVKPDWLVGVTD